MYYNKNMVVERNITLSAEFEQYLLEHPELLEDIPDGAEVVLLPKYDPELYRINFEAYQSARHTNECVAVVFVEIDALSPPRSRLVNPHITSRPSVRAISV